METQTLAIEAKKETEKIPEYLIYEIAKGGKPIYYKGYKDVLKKTKTFEEIRMESRLQSWLKAQLSHWLICAFAEMNVEITSGELGLKIPEKLKRGADIAIFSTEKFVLDEHFSDVPPEVILEIDTQADTEEIGELDYVLEKIQAYLDFGVKRVIWIFTRTRKIMYATMQEPWLTQSWDNPVEVWQGVHLNVEELVAKFKKR